MTSALPTLYAAGTELPAIHSLLRQPSQWQKIDVVISTIKRRISNKLLQKQIHFAGKITFYFGGFFFLIQNEDKDEF